MEYQHYKKIQNQPQITTKNLNPAVLNCIHSNSNGTPAVWIHVEQR